MAGKLMRDVRATKTPAAQGSSAAAAPRNPAFDRDRWAICKADVNDTTLPTHPNLEILPDGVLYSLFF